MRVAGLLTLLVCVLAAPAAAAGTVPIAADARSHSFLAEATAQPSTSIDPAGEEVGFWSRSRWAIEGVVALIVIQAVVIGWLLFERRLRQRAERSLGDALRFERTFGQIAGLLAADPSSERALRDALARVAQYFGVEHAALTEAATSDSPFRIAAEYVESGEAAPPIDPARTRVPGLAAVIDSGGILPVDTASPARASTSIGALIASPLRAGGQTSGALVVSSPKRHPELTREHERRLDAFGEVFANVLALRRARVIVHEHEVFNRAVLGAHGGEVAVLDRSGAIVAVNEAWQHAANRDLGVLSGAQPGTSYLASAPERPGHRAKPASMTSAIGSVLNGGPPLAVAEVEWDGPQGRTWSEVRVRRLERPEGGAVLSHMDVTARKRADLQVQQHLHEMAHLNMVAAVGELAASVAHELNQPLTAVLSNAQALRRLMHTPSADPQLMREIVEDIIAQDQRAGDVIQRMRRLLKKEKGDWQGVDVNQLVRDVARMFQSEATIGGVPVAIDLAPSLPHVQGDRVQLQQVVLNLLQNATHAVRGDAALRGGRVLISTAIGADGVAVRVRDAGPGIAADLLDRVFDPFFTTKRQGLGLGLSISRSIVELHGGRILARNLPAGGAEFSFTIPVEAVST